MRCHCSAMESSHFRNPDGFSHCLSHHSAFTLKYVTGGRCKSGQLSCQAMFSSPPNSLPEAPTPNLQFRQIGSLISSLLKWTLAWHDAQISSQKFPLHFNPWNDFSGKCTTENEKTWILKSRWIVTHRWPAGDRILGGISKF